MIEFTKERYFSDGFQVKEKIYVLKNPMDDTVFYVGRTKKPLSDRLHGHISAAKGKSDKFRNSIKDAHIMAIINSGRKPVIKEIESITPICLIEYLEIADREIYWMKELKKDGCEIMNIIGLRVPQPNAQLIMYKELMSENKAIPAHYYYCGIDMQGNKLYHKERLLADGMRWVNNLPVYENPYNPFKNPIWMKKMGIAV